MLFINNNLVDRMQGLYTDLNNLQDSLNSQLYSDVDDVNNILNQISQINKDINEYGETSTLLDQRALLEKELSEYADIEVSNGEPYELKIAGETALFNNILAYELEVVENPLTQEDVYDTTALDDSNLVDGELITLTLNNTTSIQVTVDTTGLTEWDVKEQIASAINANVDMNSEVKASVDDTGKLIIESQEAGENEAFDLTIINEQSSTQLSKNEDISQEATDNTHIEVLDEELIFGSGSLKAVSENLATENSNNVISSYKQSLDDIAYSLVNLNGSYVDESGTYLYGSDVTDTYNGTETVNSINLFSGSSVMTMSVNDVINNLSQNDLDYLATLQWKDDIDINSSTGSSESFSESIQELRVLIASTKENVDYKLETQEAINISLLSTYENLTKVDLDEEMINLIEFQAAYEANAKMITVVDEMIQTLLDM